MSQLNGKTALITGGSTGIGLATAIRLANDGARVAIAARNEADLEKALKEIPGNPIAIKTDVASREDRANLYEQVKKEFGSLDILFVNAGIAEFAPLSDATEDHFDKVININLKGAYFTVQSLLPILNEGSSVVLTTSVVNVKGMPGTSVYSLSKAGLRSMARTLSADLVDRKLRVNAIAPGPIETPIFGKLGMPQEALDQFSQQMIEKVPVKRFGQSEEVANAVAFLASEQSSYIVGAEIEVDGGFSQI